MLRFTYGTANNIGDGPDGQYGTAKPVRKLARSASNRFQRMRLKGASYPSCNIMKLKDITEWSERWSTPLGTLDARAPVADGVLVDLSLWGTSIINIVVECPDGKYFGSLRATRNVYDRVLEFLKRNHGRKLREVMDAEIDISEVIQ